MTASSITLKQSAPGWAYAEEVIEFQLETGTTLSVTKDHWILVWRQYSGYIMTVAKNVKMSDQFIDKNRSPLKIKSMEVKKYDTSKKVYNLMVKSLTPMNRLIIANGVIIVDMSWEMLARLNFEYPSELPIDFS